MAKVVKVFSTSTCPWCKKVKEFLKAHSIKFQDIDVATDEKALEYMVTKSGQQGVPVIEIDGKFIVGFDEPALRKALSIKS